MQGFLCSVTIAFNGQLYLVVPWSHTSTNKGKPNHSTFHADKRTSLQMLAQNGFMTLVRLIGSSLGNALQLSSP
jgi:hypothetical protein